MELYWRWVQWITLHLHLFSKSVNNSRFWKGNLLWRESDPTFWSRRAGDPPLHGLMRLELAWRHTVSEGLVKLDDRVSWKWLAFERRLATWKRGNMVTSWALKSVLLAISASILTQMCLKCCIRGTDKRVVSPCSSNKKLGGSTGVARLYMLYAYRAWVRSRGSSPWMWLTSWWLAQCALWETARRLIHRPLGNLGATFPVTSQDFLGSWPEKKNFLKTRREGTLWVGFCNDAATSWTISDIDISHRERLCSSGKVNRPTFMICVLGSSDLQLT